MTGHPSTLGALRDNRWVQRATLVLMLAALIAALNWRISAGDATAARHRPMPRDARMESSLGVTFNRAAVVADGGIVELRYTVLDVQKASKFQNDVHHPPVIKSEKRGGNPVYRTALMKQGHTLRGGQTYYILYLNNHNSVRPGETVEIDAGGGKLVSVPVS
jgi:hypothetical protein